MPVARGSQVLSTLPKIVYILKGHLACELQCNYFGIWGWQDLMTMSRPLVALESVAHDQQTPMGSAINSGCQNIVWVIENQGKSGYLAISGIIFSLLAQTSPYGQLWPRLKAYQGSLFYFDHQVKGWKKNPMNPRIWKTLASCFFFSFVSQQGSSHNLTSGVRPSVRLSVLPSVC